MIHRALKTFRLFQDISQTDLARELSISKSYLCEIEAGKKAVGFDLLERYAAVFQVPVSSLVFFSESLEKKGSVPEKFRQAVAGKIIKAMEWVALKDEAKKEEAESCHQK